MAGIVPRAWIDWTIDSAESLGLVGLFVVSATEAAIQPIPPDLVAWPMALGANSLMHVTAIILFATLGSVLGSVGGYWLGSIAGDLLLNKFVSKSSIRRLELLMKRHGSLGVFFAAGRFVQTLAWTAGAASMPIIPFCLWLYWKTSSSYPCVPSGCMESLHWNGCHLDSLSSILGLILIFPMVRWLGNF